MAVFESGSFCYASDEGMSKYIKACPVAKFSQDYKFSLFKDGETYTMSESMGDKMMDISFKLDQEVTYCVPTMTVLTTRLGPNMLKTIWKMPNGDMQEFDRQFTEDGMVMTCHHIKTNNKCKIYFMRFTEMGGQYKAVSHVGLTEFGKALGVQPDLVQKMDNDPNGRMIMEVKNGVYHHVYKSNVMPMDLTFKLGQEFEYKNPICTHDVMKGFAQRCENTLVINFMGKNKEFTVTMTITKNFLVREVQMVGTGLSYKSIMVKV